MARLWSMFLIRLRRQTVKISLFGICVCVIVMIVLTFCNPPAQTPLGRTYVVSSTAPAYEIETHLLIVVMSAPANQISRQVIRNTWASALASDVKLRFVVGMKNLNGERVHSLEEEQKLHTDLLLLRELEESYGGLTNKLLQSFLWISRHVNFKFLLKVDEDSFVQVDKLITELSSKTQERLYWGFFDGRAHVKTGGKWQENDFTLCDRYLPYALGGGYVLSADLVTYVASNTKLLQLFTSEDVSLGIWLAPLQINRVHDPLFDTEYKSRGCHNSYIVTHKKSHEQMTTLHNNLQSKNKLCEKEFKVRNSYIYDWSVPPTQCCQRKDPSIP